MCDHFASDRTDEQWEIDKANREQKQVQGKIDEMKRLETLLAETKAQLESLMAVRLVFDNLEISNNLLALYTANGIIMNVSEVSATHSYGDVILSMNEIRSLINLTHPLLSAVDANFVNAPVYLEQEAACSILEHEIGVMGIEIGMLQEDIDDAKYY